jgi:hypothetical protein
VTKTLPTDKKSSTERSIQKSSTLTKPKHSPGSKVNTKQIKSKAMGNTLKQRKIPLSIPKSVVKDVVTNTL